MVLFVAWSALLYFIGVVGERSAGEQAWKAAEQRYSRSIQDGLVRLEKQQSIGALLAAQVSVYRATVALDNRNFGIANDAMAKAVVSLGRVEASVVDAQTLQNLQRQASGIRVSVAPNLSSQRQQLLALANEIDLVVAKYDG